jgi:arginase
MLTTMTSSARVAVRLLATPYDSGRRDERMGAGPLALLGAGAARRLESAGHPVSTQVLEAGPEWTAELRTAFELQRTVAQHVADARRHGEVPLLLAGNCNTTLGVLAGLGDAARVGLVWLDAHGDFNDPERDSTGFLDGQGLAMVVGRCWRGLTGSVPGFRPVPEERVLLVGARDLDPAEGPALAASGITVMPPSVVRDRVETERILRTVQDRWDVVLIHVDLDVYDPVLVGPANGYPAPGGLTEQEVTGFVDQIASRWPVVSAALASYDPDHDTSRRVAAAAQDLLVRLAGHADPAAP